MKTEKSRFSKKDILLGLDGCESLVIKEILKTVRFITREGGMRMYNTYHHLEGDKFKYSTTLNKTYLNEYDIVDYIGFKFIQNDKYSELKLKDLDNSKIKILEPSSVEYRLSIDKYGSHLLKLVRFLTKIDNKYDVELFVDIIVGKFNTPKEFTELFNKFSSIIEVDKTAFINEKFKILDDSIDIDVDDARHFSLRYGSVEFMEELKDVLVKYDTTLNKKKLVK